MDSQLMALATTAGTAIVAAMATDGWQKTREGIVGLWRRFRPDRVVQIEEELEDSRTGVVALRGELGGPEGDAYRAVWQGNVTRLLISSPEAFPSVRRLIEELADDSWVQTKTSMHAVARHHGRVFQAGRDQHISER